MKYSLKAWLVTMCVVGAVIGGMGKLLLESPEGFLNVLRLASTLGPFLLAVATIVSIGLRSVPKRRGLIVWGCALLLSPIVMLGLMVLFLPSGNPLQLMTTHRLIANRLPLDAQSPWVWQELERRLTAGRLTSEQADAAVAQFADYMTTSNPAGWKQPITWQKQFLTNVMQAKMISNDTLLKLLDAFYGRYPKILPVSPASPLSPRFSLAVEYGNTWGDHSGLGVALAWHVKEVQLDGVPAAISRAHKHNNIWDGTCEANLTPGEHEVSVVVEAAYIDSGNSGGPPINGTSLDNVPPNQWPKARKRWTTTVKAPLTVEPVINP
jgi:hypothetical protein